MNKLARKALQREDFVNALQEFDSIIDITVDDLIEVNARAEKFARIRETGSLRVADIMSTPVETIAPDGVLADAAHLMVNRRISGLPVVDDQQKLLGVITEADFLRELGVPAHHPTHSLWHTLEAMFAHHIEVAEPGASVADIMIAEVITVAPEQSLHEVLDVMTKNRIKRVIVCGTMHKVVGMITRSDLVRVFFDHVRQQK